MLTKTVGSKKHQIKTQMSWGYSHSSLIRSEGSQYLSYKLCEPGGSASLRYVVRCEGPTKASKPRKLETALVFMSKCRLSTRQTPLALLLPALCYINRCHENAASSSMGQFHSFSQITWASVSVDILQVKGQKQVRGAETIVFAGIHRSALQW